MSPALETLQSSSRNLPSRFALRKLLFVLVAGFVATALVLLTAGQSEAQSPEITIEKSTNGNDADTAPGPTLTAGDQVTWAYEIVVNGPTTMFDVIVTDSSGVVPQCDINSDGTVENSHVHPGPLNTGQSFFCTASGVVHPEGTFASTATVVASSFDGMTKFDDSDPSYYTAPPQFTIDPGVAIETLVNGVEADTTPGPYVQEGSSVAWSYVVTNTGNVPLTDIEVTNSAGVPVDCGGGSPVIAGPMAPGETVSCSGVGPAPAAGSGVQQGVGQALAAALDPTTGAPVAQTDAQDPAAYTPVQLPGTLAFTGPTDVAHQLGLVLLTVGLALSAGGTLLGRRKLPTAG